MSLGINAQITAQSDLFILSPDKSELFDKVNLSAFIGDSILLDSRKTIKGFALNGSIIHKNNNSFVRIILKDTNGNNYVVLESCRLYNDVDTMLLNNYCEESKCLPNIHPLSLHIYQSNSSVNIKHATLLLSNTTTIDNEDVIPKVPLMTAIENKLKQSKYIANNINKNNEKYHRLWRAEANELTILPWDQKKRVFGIEEESIPTGFDYYASGIFELGESNKERGLTITNNSPFIDTFDWRNRHGVNWNTPVRDQETGMGCWAFTAVGVTEALVNLYYNRKIDYDLSEQEVISCSPHGTNTSGGNEFEALSWISTHGVSEEESFPFSNSDEPCSNKGFFSEFITMNGISIVPNHTINNNDSVKKALIEHGPLTSGFLSYRENHAMTLVGYSTLHEGDTIYYFGNFYQTYNNFDVIQHGDSRIGSTYWIFKNSYGSNRYYEHKGYVYVLFNDQYCFRVPHYANMPISSLIYTDADIAITDNDGDGYYFWGIGPKPAHCPSWVPDTPDGDDSNINYGPMNSYGHLDVLSAGITINTPVSFSGFSTTSNRYGIVNGGVLTVTGTMSLTENSSIRVCEGGVLIVDGGVIQNANITMIPGSTLIVRNNGKIHMANGEKFEAPIGVVVNMESGEID